MKNQPRSKGFVRSSAIKRLQLQTKYTSQNLIPGQKLTPADAQARTSVSTFVRGSPSSLNLVSFRDQNVVNEKFTGIF